MFLKSAGLTEFPGTIFMILKRPTKSKGALSACVGRGKQKGKVYILNRFVTLGWFHAVHYKGSKLERGPDVEAYSGVYCPYNASLRR